MTTSRIGWKGESFARKLYEKRLPGRRLILDLAPSAPCDLVVLNQTGSLLWVERFVEVKVSSRGSPSDYRLTRDELVFQERWHYLHDIVRLRRGPGDTLTLMEPVPVLLERG